MDSKRSAKEVFSDHLLLAREGAVAEDFSRNYADNVVVMTGWGVYHGEAGIRELADMLERELPEPEFQYTTELVEGDVAFLEWTGKSATAGTKVTDGADTFVIVDGRIAVQTIHYTVTEK